MERRHWSPEVVEIGDQIVALSVAQAARLSQYLEEVHGIKADASPVVLPPKPDLVVPPPVPTEFCVVLESFEASSKIAVIKAVRENMGLSIRDARDFVDAVPKVVRDRLPKADAEKLNAQLKAVGAKVSIKPIIE